jgi:hypothetical protein
MLSLIFESRYGSSVESGETGIYAKSSKAPFPAGPFRGGLNNKINKKYIAF